MPHPLDPMFRPRRVAFIGGSNLKPTLGYHRDLGFDGETWVVNPRYDEIEGYRCYARLEDLPAAPDLAFIAIRREAAVEAVEILKQLGCGAFVCNAAGFAETGDEGGALQRRLVEAADDMPALGPNAVGLVNYVDPMAAMMDHFGVHPVKHGVAIVSQGGGVLCDAVFCDRGLSITHMVGCGNQAVTGAESCVDYLLDDARVRAVGLSFEGLHDVAGLRRAAAKALRLGKPIVALKFGKSAAGARAAASHTASMTGSGSAWEALFKCLGIVSVASESEFFETLKLFDSGQLPKGRRVLVTAASGVMGVMLADHLSAANFELPQPDEERAQKLRELLPGIATPCNPQDVTMAVWNDKERQREIYAALLEQGYDTALMVQNYPRDGMWDVSEYEAQVEALGEACDGHDVAALQLAPMVDCFPAHARDHTLSLGLAAMQGLEECVAALGHALWWRERRDVLREEGLEALAEVDGQPSAGGLHLNEAEAKALLGSAGVCVPEYRVARPDDAAAVAAEIGFPVAIKALDARLLHKTECGAVRIGLTDGDAVTAAVVTMRDDMARKVPDIPLNTLLVEKMADDVIGELMASVSFDPSVGPVMMIAGGGVEAELWNDSILLAAPFTRAEIARGLECLKITRRLHGWRGAPAADVDALLDMLQALGDFALREAVEEVEINPILVGRRGAIAVDAVLEIRQRKARVA